MEVLFGKAPSKDQCFRRQDVTTKKEEQMKKKLVLHRETLRQLTEKNIQKAAGGGPWTVSDCCHTYDHACNTDRETVGV